MIQRKIGLLSGLIIFISGLIFKYFHIIAPGTTMAIGLIIIIVIFSLNLADYKNKKIKEYLIYLLIIILTTRIFALIQNRIFLEIFLGGLTIGIFSYSIAYVAQRLKNRKKIN
jgi:hypothetical protein